jgi:cytochrome P450
VGAGSETTATLLTAATFFLLKNPSKLELLTQEIRSTFANESEINMASATGLKYQGAVLEEGLRIFPPVPGTSARVISETGATICGRFAPSGTVVGVAPWSAYHSPLNFRDPEDFVPERWLGDPRYADDNKAVFQPFSIGPRSCIGRT